MNSETYGSGFYRLYFDTDNVLKLIYDGLIISSNYWPDPDPKMNLFQKWRSTYNNSRYVVLNTRGVFHSSDKFNFTASDFGEGPRRRLTMDIDGTLRLYSLDERGEWTIVWKSWQEQCKVHGCVSRMNSETYGSGFYRLYFDTDNVLKLIYDGLIISSNYWPDPDPKMNLFQKWRSTYNNSRYVVLNTRGVFHSSDKFNFTASDFGEGPRRRLTMDIDGTLNSCIHLFFCQVKESR
eukprot:Gb_32115 [translate_table: standard]